MTITSNEEFRRIGEEDARTGGHTMFDPIGGPSHVAYLEGVIVGLRAQLSSAEDDGLTLSITREVEPKEIPYLVFGTGGLSYPWWKDVDWVCVVDGEEFPVEDYSSLDTAEVDDYLIFKYDDPNDDEGTFRGRKKVTFREIVAAAAVAIRKGYVREPDAIKEDLGMCDAEEADAILQLAVFGGEDTIYG